MPRRQHRPCCAICAATGVAWTRQQPTTTRRSSPFSWRKVRPWTSWPGRPRPRLSPRETPRPPECARGPRVPRWTSRTTEAGGLSRCHNCFENSFSPAITINSCSSMKVACLNDFIKHMKFQVLSTLMDMGFHWIYHLRFPS